MSSSKDKNKRVPLVMPYVGRGTGKTITVYNGGRVVEKRIIKPLPLPPIEKKLSKAKRIVSASHKNIKKASTERGMILKIREPKIRNLLLALTHKPKSSRPGWKEVKPKVKKPLSDNAVKALMAEGVMGLLDYVQAISQLDSVIIMKNNAVKVNKMEKAANLRSQEKDTLFRLKSIEKRLGKIRMKLLNF